MTGLDANVLIRFVTQDDPVQSPKADAIMNSLTAQEPGWISLTALAELIWVMSQKFRASRQRIDTLVEGLLAREEIVLEQSDLVRKAINQYRVGSADFSDYLIALAAQDARCKGTLTFDHKAARTAGMTLVP